jgi:hypothetical protein
VKHDDPVTLHDSGHAVGNHHTRSTLHCTVERLLHDLLTLFVQGTRRLIKDHNLRRLDQSSSDRHSLFLASRQLAAFETADLVKTSVELATLHFHSCAVKDLVQSGFINLFDVVPCLPYKGSKLHFWLLFRLSAELLHNSEVKLTLTVLESLEHVILLCLVDICPVYKVGDLCRFKVEVKALQYFLPSTVSLRGLLLKCLGEGLKVAFD